MRVNESTVLLGPRVRLVPYRRAHVLRYNQWMQDPELLEPADEEVPAGQALRALQPPVQLQTKQVFIRV